MIEKILLNQPVPVLALVYILMGLATYHAANILMKGSIFSGLRGWGHRRAATNRFAALIEKMLACLLCTGTQVALWTSAVLIWAPLLASGLWGEFLAPLPLLIAVPTTIIAWAMLAFAIALFGWTYKKITESRDDAVKAKLDAVRKRCAEQQKAAANESPRCVPSEVGEVCIGEE